ADGAWSIETCAEAVGVQAIEDMPRSPGFGSGRCQHQVAELCPGTSIVQRVIRCGQSPTAAHLNIWRSRHSTGHRGLCSTGNTSRARGYR
ncbi:unnamed protein product, partial [Polarella glacialis]